MGSLWRTALNVILSGVGNENDQTGKAERKDYKRVDLSQRSGTSIHFGSLSPARYRIWAQPLYVQTWKLLG